MPIHVSLEGLFGTTADCRVLMRMQQCGRWLGPSICFPQALGPIGLTTPGWASFYVRKAFSTVRATSRLLPQQQTLSQLLSEQWFTRL